MVKPLQLSMTDVKTQPSAGKPIYRFWGCCPETREGRVISLDTIKA